MLLRLLVLAALGSAVLPATAPAAPIPTGQIPTVCHNSSTMYGTAYACDPAGLSCDETGQWCSPNGRHAAHISLTLGDERRSAPRGPLDVGFGEELQLGETVELRWSTPSSRAVFAVVASGAKESRTVVLALRWRPTWVRVTASADGSLTVASEKVSGVIPADTWPDVTWRERTAIGAARGVVRALSMQHGSWTSLRTVCAALAPGVAEYFWRDVIQDDGVEACPVPMYFAVVGGENVPHVRWTEHAGTRVRVQGDRAVLRTRLTHHFGDERPPSSVTARALLVRGDDGVWFLATPFPLLALSSLGHPPPPSDRRLRAEYTQLAAKGRREAAARARERAALEAATVRADAPQPCRPPTQPDPMGDVMAQGGDRLARHQADHLDVDLVERGVSATCVFLRTAGPLPARFTVRTTDLEIIVKDGGVLALEDDRFNDAKPLSGIVAHLEPSLFVLQTPTKQPVDGRIDLTLGRDGDYHDADWKPFWPRR